MGLKHRKHAANICNSYRFKSRREPSCREKSRHPERVVISYRPQPVALDDCPNCGAPGVIRAGRVPDMQALFYVGIACTKCSAHTQAYIDRSQPTPTSPGAINAARAWNKGETETWDS